MAAAASFLEMDECLWDEVLKVNLTGTYRCCKLFLPGMLSSGLGRIINIASTVSKVAYPYSHRPTAYSLRDRRPVVTLNLDGLKDGPFF